MSGSKTDRVVAVLGPTNTGKTHLAIERMLAHGSGMIGLPLRLLAREVYDRIVRQKGARAVALVTGEERIAPEGARYVVATVEAMPLERPVDFLAVDEIQLATDPDRGHIFTHRLLHARGQSETMLLGADTMRPLIRRLLPHAEIVRRERLSTLSYAGARKLTKLPKRTAIVAFSAEDVYAIAELIRRQRGGAAVVMGALSPRTRNAQVALYQSGEVDFLVATDAIGMGLNMDVDHVAFAARAKFDGRRNRVLRPDEIAQIAGRAGRFRDDGTFGETGDCPPFDEETVLRVSAHDFEPHVAVEWRSAELDFRSVGHLIRSLEAPPTQPGLVRVRGALDETALRQMAMDPDIVDHIARVDDVRRLWDVCQTPDFRKATPDEHARLLGEFARHLLGPARRLPQDWIAREIDSLDRTAGDIDALQTRLAFIRTWTYAANRPDWLDDCEGWRVRTRAVEDKLSDALHEVLTQRFIDRRTSVLMRSLKQNDVLLAGVTGEGEVTVEGHYVGRLDGLQFRPDPRAGGREAQAVRHAAFRALRPDVTRRLRAVAQAPDGGFRLDADGAVTLDGQRVAMLETRAPLLSPAVRLIGGDLGDGLAAAAARHRIEAWLADALARDLAPLVQLNAAIEAGALKGMARGLAWQLIEAGGALDRRAAAAAVQPLTAEDRKALAALGVRVGRHSVFMPALLRGRAARLHAILRAAACPEPAGLFLPSTGAQSLPVDPARSWGSYAAAGYRPAGPRAVRFDALERCAAALHAAREGGRDFPLDPVHAQRLGCAAQDMEGVLQALGYRRTGPARWRPPSPGRPARQPAGPETAFSQLGALITAKRGGAS
ncbi:MAG: helicase-related protein [Hyphomonadaceae bacterium]|nr:helicase-related protein [Hyphomonadaceae bacterium]